MGLREKVTITLVIIALIQIACSHCMPRTPRKASLKRYLNDLKPVKNNPAPTPNSYRVNKVQKHTFGKTAQNAKICENSPSKKSLYQTYKFPEMEFPLDNSPKDPFYIGINLNDNKHVSTLQKARNLQNTAINDLKKEMKMKRKLLSNKQTINDNSPLKPDMSSVQFTSNTDAMRLLDSESFPEVQYPLNTMETWGSNYRSYLPITHEKQFSGFGQQTLNRKAKEDMIKPFTRLTKAKASKYLQSYDKLKEEQRRTSTQNSKRSNVGQKGSNFTKTATCEKISDDFMTAGLLSNVVNNSREIKRTLEPSIESETSSENMCPVTDYPKHSVPIPYRGIENSTENECAFKQKKNNKELQDVDAGVIAQTLQLIEEILLHDDTSSAKPTGNYSKEIENNICSSDCTNVPANVDIPTTLTDSAKNFTDCLVEEISQEVPDDNASGILQDEMPPLSEEILTDNYTAVESPLSVRMPLSFSEPIEFKAATNDSERGPNSTAHIANSTAVSGSKSVIIIPINSNSDGKSLSHLLETTTGTPIIVYLPSTQNSGIPSQTQNQIMSSLLENFVPNTDLSNVLSNIAPLQNDNPSSTALVSELLNSISDNGSSLPMHEALPKNSMCYNNESSPSSIKEKPISDILIDKSLTDDAPLTTTICDENLSEQSTESEYFDMKTETLPLTPDFEHPIFDFAGSEFSSLSHGPYNNVLINELPILAREINLDQQYFNVSTENLLIATQNMTSEDLHKNISEDASPKIASEIATVALNQNFSHDDSQPQPIMIDKMPATPKFDTAVEKQLPVRMPLLLNPFSDTIPDYLSEMVEMNLLPTPSTTTDITPSLPDPVVNNSPITTDMSIKSELYKIRQILDKMLSSQTSTDSQTTPMNAIMTSISETDSFPMLVGESLEPIQTLTESVDLPGLDETVLPLPTFDSVQLQKHENTTHVPIGGSSSDTLPLPVDQSLNPSAADRPPLRIDETIPPKPVFENPAENKPYLLDNLVTPFSETRTKDIPENGFPHTIDGSPSKMDLVIPNIHELPTDETQLLVDDLPIIVHQELAKNPKSVDLKNILPMHVFEPQNSLIFAPVSDLIHPDKTLCDVASDRKTTTSYSYMNKLQQDFPPSIVHSSEDEPYLPDDSLSTINAKTSKFAHTQTDKDLPLVEDRLSVDFTTPDTLVTHIPMTSEDKMLPTTENTSTDLQLPINNIPSTSKLSIAMALLENVLYEISKGDFSSPVTKPFPVTPSFKLDKTEYQEEIVSPPLEAEEIICPKSEALPSPEKPEDILSLADKESLVNAYLGIPSKDLSFKLDETSIGKPGIQTVDMETQNRNETLSLDNSDVLLLTENVTLPLNTLYRTSPSKENTLSASKLPITKALLDNVLSDVTTGGFWLPAISKALPVKSSSVLDKSMYYAESPLSPINEEHPSPADVIISSTTVPPTVFDEPNDSNLSYSRESEDSLPLEVDKSLTEISSSDIPIKNTLPLGMSSVDISSPKAEILSTETPTDQPNIKTIQSSKLLMSEALLQNILSDVTSKSFSLPVSKVLPVKSSSALDKTLYYANSHVSDITDESPSEKPSVNKIISTTYAGQPTEDNQPFSGQFEDTMPLEVNKSLLEVSNLVIPSKMSSLTDKTDFKPNTPSDLPLSNTKILSSSKVPIAKALLQNVLSDVNLKGLSSKALPVKLSSGFHKPIKYVESPVSAIKEDNKTPGDDIISNTTRSDQPNDIDFTYSRIVQSKLDQDSLPFEADTIFPEVSNLDIGSYVSSLINKTNDDMSSPKVEILPKETPNDLPLSNTKTLSSSKLPITKTLLENVLSDVTSKSFSLPVSKVLPVKLSSVIDKTHSSESPLLDLTEGGLNPCEIPSVNENLSSTSLSNQPTDNNLKLYGQIENNFSSEVDKTLSEVSSLDTTPEMSSSLTDWLQTKSNIDITLPNPEMISKNTPSELAIPNNKSLSCSKLPITKAPLKNVLSDVTTKDFSLAVSKVPHVKSSSILDKAHYLESPLSDLVEESPIPLEYNNHTVSEFTSEDIPLEITSFMDSVLPKSNVNTTSAKAEVLPKDIPSELPSLNTKTLSSSKLFITKALLENVLSDINTKGFSVPIAKSPPVESRTRLDKTLYYMDSSLSGSNEESSDDDFPSPEVNDDVFELSPENIFTDHRNLDTSPEDSPIDQITKDGLDDLTEQIEGADLNEKFSHNPMEDTFDLPTQVDDNPVSAVSLSDSNNMSSDLQIPQNKRLFASRIPITKALLEKVLSDINDGSIRP